MVSEWRFFMRIVLVGNEKLTVNVKDFWERSVNGFGSYSQEISKKVYDKHITNSSQSIKNYSFKAKFKEIGESFYLFIEK